MTGTKNPKRIKSSTKDRRYYAATNIIVTIFMLIVFLPLIYTVAASFSSPGAVNAGKVFLFPVEPTLDGYKAVFKHNLFFKSYCNTFFYTITGTLINLALTLTAAYALARKGLPFKGPITFLFTFTMLFNGGTIPNYMLIKDLGMVNTIWVMLIPGAISIYNLIIARTYIQGIPVELEEAAHIDGCNDFLFFFKIVLPLSKTVIAVLALYYAVAHWNDYFTAFLYINDRELYPMQMILREVLIANSVSASEVMDAETMAARQGMTDLLKYSMIIISSLPVIVLYPCVKKHFMKGVMIGAIKG